MAHRLKDEETDERSLSLTKGCFVFKPKLHTKEGKKSAGIEEEHWKSRQDLFTSCWNSTNTEIEALHKQIFSDFVISVTDFVRRACSENKDQDIIFTEIPTAALILGINLSDHFLLFHLLTQQFRESVTPFIVSLKSEDGATFASLVQNFVYSITECSNLDEEDGTSSDIKKQDCTFQFVKQWYKDQVDIQKACKGRSPRKIKKSHRSQTVHTKGHPIVVIFEDVEAFNPSVLQDFILTCNNYAVHLPFVFIMGLASASGAVHHLLPQRALSCLTIETFHSSPATEYINNLINKVLITSQVPFKLGPKVFQLLIDIVLFHDFSIANFSHMLKLCMFEHFYENESSELCCPLPEIRQRLELLPLSELREFCRLPSVVRYIEEHLDKHFGSRKASMEFIYTNIEALHIHHQNYVVMLTCLHALVKNLPTSPMGKQLREIYICGLENKLSDTKEFKQSFKLLNSLSSKEDLEFRIQECLTALQEIPFISDTQKHLIASLQNFLEELKEVCMDAIVVEKAPTESVKAESGKVLSRSQLKEKLKAKSQEQKLTPYEKLRNDFFENLSALFDDLKPLCTRPFHEALYFNSPAVMRKMLVASPQVSCHKALMSPHDHLQCNCCNVKDVNQIPSTLPPVSIAYKLYLQCGRFINLSDWLQAFKAIKMGESEASSRKSKNNRAKDNEAFIHAQFLHSVSELNFLGFVKSTKKKADHVEKLVWNSGW